MYLGSLGEKSVEHTLINRHKMIMEIPKFVFAFCKNHTYLS